MPCAQSLSLVQLLSSVRGFFQVRIWSGLPLPTPGDLPDLGIKPESLTSPVLEGPFFTTSATWEDPSLIIIPIKRK